MGRMLPMRRATTRTRATTSCRNSSRRNWQWRESRWQAERLKSVTLLFAPCVFYIFVCDDVNGLYCTTLFYTIRLCKGDTGRENEKKKKGATRERERERD